MRNAAMISNAASWRIGNHPRRQDHKALFDGTGRVRVTFAIWETPDDIRAALARIGYVVHDDNTVTKAEG